MDVNTYIYIYIFDFVALYEELYGGIMLSIYIYIFIDIYILYI